MTRQEIALRLDAFRQELQVMRAHADSPSLELALITLLEHTFLAQQAADPGTVKGLSPYDEELGLHF